MQCVQCKSATALVWCRWKGYLVLIPNSNQQAGIWSGGTTQSIYMHPPGADGQANNYLFWVNIATIERQAHYSYFPGYQRLHLPLTSPGLHLRFSDPEQTVELDQFESIYFDGARPLLVKPKGPAITAFNVIMQMGLSATVNTFADLGPDLSGSNWLQSPSRAESRFYVIVILSGAVTLKHQQSISLGQGDAYLVTPDDLAGMTSSPPAIKLRDQETIGLMAQITVPTQT